MYLYALLKNVSFNVTMSNISLYLNDKISFHEFNNTLELFNKIHEILGNKMVEVLNCYYDDKYLIQAFYLENLSNDNYEHIILVKRYINENDSYTYLGVDSVSLQTVDDFKYMNMEFNDVKNILKNKTKNKGVLVRDSGELYNVDYKIITNPNRNNKTISNDDISGEIVVNGIHCAKSIKYINIPVLLNIYEKDNLSEEQFANLILTKMNETGSTHYYMQHKFDLGILNCYCNAYGQTLNSIISSILKDNIYGDVLVCLENHLNDDSRILDLNIETFNGIIKIMSKKNFEQKNKLFCNIFYELAHM